MRYSFPPIADPAKRLQHLTQVFNGSNLRKSHLLVLATEAVERSWQLIRRAGLTPSRTRIAIGNAVIRVGCVEGLNEPLFSVEIFDGVLTISDKRPTPESNL